MESAMTKREILIATRELPLADRLEIIEIMLTEQGVDMDVLAAGSLIELVRQRAAESDAHPETRVNAREAVSAFRERLRSHA
jgi:hypothetical protein